MFVIMATTGEDDSLYSYPIECYKDVNKAKDRNHCFNRFITDSVMRHEMNIYTNEDVEFLEEQFMERFQIKIFIHFGGINFAVKEVPYYE